MKTPEQLHAHQASLPPLRSYFIVYERPHGSYTWTQIGDMFTERFDANEFARNRVDHKERPICDCVVSECNMQRMPTPEGSEPVALLAKFEEIDQLYFGKGHAR
jgi:hypothetical protein